MRHSGGTVTDVLYNASLYRDEGGGVVGVFAAARDVTEHRRMELQLEARESAFRAQSATLQSLIDGATGPVFSIDTEYRYTSFNAKHADAMRRLYGAEIELGKSLFADVATDADRAVAQANLAFGRQNLARALAGETVTAEAYSGEEPGSQRYFQITSTPIRTADGTVSGVAVYAHDLTERKKAEEALRQSEQRLALTLDATHDGMWDWHIPSGDGVFSPRYYTMLGYEPYEFPQTYAAWRKLVHPQDVRGMERRVKAAIEKDRDYVAETRLRTKNGDWRWVLSRGKVVERDGDGNPVRMVGTTADVTELRQAEQAAAERSHFLEELLEALPVPVFYKDADLRYVGCNEAFAQFLGLSRDQVIGKNVFEVYPAGLAERYAASDQELLEHPEKSQENELETPLPDRNVRSVVTHKAVFSDVTGKPAGIVGVNLDVTEIRQAEKELAAGAVQLRLTLKAAVAALGATTEMRDPYTAGHQRRVAELAGAIAAELGWDEARIESLRTAALLHDIGKIVVPAEILSKPGRLTETEMLLIRQHAAAGADTVADIDFEGAIADMIRQHHERLDGSGYPAGLRGAEILPEARVLAVADVVEAMITHRPYRPSLTIGEALAEIEGGADVRYDAEAAAACMRLFKEKGFTLSE